MAALLEVQGLSIAFSIDGRWHRAVEGIDLRLEAEKTLCLVGESGCGKSVTALALLRLLPSHNARIESGSIRLGDLDVATADDDDVRDARGKRISMVFQEPGAALNPVFTVGAQLTEALRLHKPTTRAAAKAAALQMMREVGISSPEERFDQYPHELSGGMKQRIMIAMALLCEPAVLVADEPTTALDVTIQAQILDLIRRLQRERKMGLVLISHDLGIVAEMADEVAVMYAGMVVERAPAAALFANPLHPYTRALRDSLPALDDGGAREALRTIPGRVPALTEFPDHCRFLARCPVARDECRQGMPPLRAVAPGHHVRCVLA